MSRISFRYFLIKTGGMVDLIRGSGIYVAEAVCPAPMTKVRGAAPHTGDCPLHSRSGRVLKNAPQGRLFKNVQMQGAQWFDRLTMTEAFSLP
jgi:hypothetical protein